MLIYAQIEDNAIARFKEASTTDALGYRFAEISSYGGQLADTGALANVRKFPAAWFTIAGDKVVKRLGRKTIHRLTLVLMLATRNVRGERSTRHGTVAEPGVYQLIEDGRNLLVGQDLGLPIAPFSAGAVRTLFNAGLGADARSVFAVEFGTDYTYAPPDPEIGAPDLTSIGLRYYLQDPIDDDELDAEDVVVLPTV